MLDKFLCFDVIRGRHERCQTFAKLGSNVHITIDAMESITFDNETRSIFMVLLL